MKTPFLLILLMIPVFSAGAQGIQRTRDALAVTGYNNARVVVVEQGNAAETVRLSDRAPRKGRITTYRVSLFRDNNQTAGENARSVAARFREQYPGIPVQIAYESPYFSVTAGNFVEKVDAIALYGKVLSAFPKAVVTQEQVTVSDIISQQRSASAQNHDNSESASH